MNVPSVDMPVGRGPEGMQPILPVGPDLQGFAEEKAASVSTRTRLEVSMDECLAQIMGGDKEVVSALEKMNATYDVRTAQELIETVAESEEARKGTVISMGQRTALVEAEDAQNQAESLELEAEARPNESRDEEPDFGEGEDGWPEAPPTEELAVGEAIAGSSPLTTEEGATDVLMEAMDPGNLSYFQKPIPKPPSKNRTAGSNPWRVVAVRARLAKLQPGADASAFREVMAQVAQLDERLQLLQRATQENGRVVRDLAPLLESVAVRTHVLPEASAGGMVLDQPQFPGIWGTAAPTETEPEGLRAEVVAEKGQTLKPWHLAAGMAATLLAGIGIGTAVSRIPSVLSTPNLDHGKAQNITQAQRVKLRYLRAERRQLEIRLQIEVEAQKLVDLREAALEKAHWSKVNKEQSLAVAQAEGDLKEAKDILIAAQKDAERARHALVWVAKAGV